MGKVGGFLEFPRREPGYRSIEERLRDYRAVEHELTGDELFRQAGRCMACGIPFCHGAGCPVENVIPEFNHLVYEGRWQEALDVLLATNNFPEFTGRICPAPCEAACVLEFSEESPVTIRLIELAVIEKGFERGYFGPEPPEQRTGKKVAVVGAGPAGLAAADTLNHIGHEVTVFDQAQQPGGILRYGIPDFKLEKCVVERRTNLMAEEGVRFEMNVTVGEDVSYRFLQNRFDAICLTGGAREPRNLNAPGRELDGIHFAMDFLTCQNRLVSGESVPAEQMISAEGKDVMVIGGGDTGSDCVGTSLRQGAKSVTQIEILPKPPDSRDDSTPWPLWPVKLRTSSSHKEGGERIWSASVSEFRGSDGKLTEAVLVDMDVTTDGGRLSFTPREDTERTVPAQLVLLAMGFVGPAPNPMYDDLGLGRDARGNIKVGDNHMTTVPGIFSGGDIARGQSLVVRAIADGRKAAFHIHEYLSTQDG